MTSPVRIKFPHVQHRSESTLSALVVAENETFCVVNPGAVSIVTRAELLADYHPADQAAFRIFRELISIPK